MSAVLDSPFPVLAEPTVAAVALPSITDSVIAQFRATETALRALAEKWRAVAFDVSTPKGMAAAKAARAELREQGRYAVQRAEAKVKGEVNDLKRAMSTEVERLVAIIAPIEDHVDQQIKAREDQLEAGRREREAREAERIAGHERGLQIIRNYVQQARGLPAARITLGIEALRAMSFGEGWQEFAAKADATRNEVLSELDSMRAAAEAREAEAKRLEAQRIENERVAAEQRAEARRLEDEARRLEAERERIRGEEARRLQCEADAKAVAEYQARLAETAAATAKMDAPWGLPQAAAEAVAPIAAQACRPEDKAMLATPAGVELVQAVAEQLAEEEPSLLVGAIGTRLGFQLRAEFIEKQLGIKPAARRQSAVLWRESAWPQICSALVKHIEGLR